MSDNGAFVFHSDAALDPVTGNVVHGNNVTVTAERVGEWWLFTATLFADAEMIISSRFEILAMPGISIIPNGSTLDIAMPQAEIGSYRTSFIITEGAPGTRSSDMVTIPVRNNIHRLPFSALVEVNKNWDIPPSKSPLIFNVKDYQENGLFTHGFRGNNFSDAGSPFISMEGVINMWQQPRGKSFQASVVALMEMFRPYVMVNYLLRQKQHGLQLFHGQYCELEGRALMGSIIFLVISVICVSGIKN